MGEPVGNGKLKSQNERMSESHISIQFTDKEVSSFSFSFRKKIVSIKIKISTAEGRTPSQGSSNTHKILIIVYLLKKILN
jgi:hypothetical protein